MTDPHVMQSGHAPTPFTADEIRDGCPPGRTIRLLVEPAGAVPFMRVTRFVSGDAEGAVQEAQRFSVDGEPLDEPSQGRTTWAGFQSHASFPADATTIDRETITIPAGTFECHRYTVRTDNAIDTFWFATTLPGMPVKMVSERDGETTFTMTMLENTVGGA